MKAATAPQPALSPFACPRCGGGLSVREGSRLGRCRSCATSYLALFPGNEARYLLPPALDESDIGGRVRELLRGEDLPRDLPGRAVLQSSELLLVPYWRFQCTVVGHLSGTRMVRRTLRESDLDSEGSRFSMYGSSAQIRRTEAVDKPIRELWSATLSACPVDDLGVPSLSPLRQRSAGMLVTRKLGSLSGVRFFDRSAFSQGKVLDVMVPRGTARKGADALFQRFIETRGFDVEGKEIRHLRLQERCYLLYYPIHVVRFRYNRRVYRVVLDGSHGGLIQAQLPTAPRHVLGILLATVFTAALLTAAPLRMILLPPEGMAELTNLTGEPGFWGALAIAAAGLAGAARHALRHLRFDADKVVHG